MAVRDTKTFLDNLAFVVNKQCRALHGARRTGRPFWYTIHIHVPSGRHRSPSQWETSYSPWRRVTLHPTQ